jgi:hypothetical protein
MPEVLVQIVELAARLGVVGINKIDGCWEHQVDAHWWFAVNGHPEATECSKGTKVPPFAAYIEFNGWPAGIVDPGGGTLCAGAVGNEANLIAALAASPNLEE